LYNKGFSAGVRHLVTGFAVVWLKLVKSTSRNSGSSSHPIRSALRLPGFAQLSTICAFLLCFLVVKARDVDLAILDTPRQGLQVWGGAATDALGNGADAGDVNKDGFRDIVIGASSADRTGQASAGAAYLVFGSSKRTTSSVDTAAALLPGGIKITGALLNDLWGYSVGGAGDYNKDGIDDIIISGYGYDPLSRATAGAAVVIFGKTSGWADIDLASFTSGSAGFWIYGAAAGDQCGVAASGAGDVNGDGADDVIIGCNAADPLSRVGGGISYVLFGHSTATAFNTVDLASFSSGSTGFKILAAAAGDAGGTRVGSAGDMNGDGYGDVISSSMWYDGGGRTDCGAVYVIFGHSTATAFTDIDLAALSSSRGFRVSGAATNNRLGWSVSSAGDFNHDGYDDIVIGSRANKAYILYGHSGLTTFTHVNLTTFTGGGNAGFIVSGLGNFGLNVGGGADVNGDGVDDVVISAPSYTANGVAYVLYGRWHQQLPNIDVLTGLPVVTGFSIIGTPAIATGEWCVNFVEDFDGDGVGEVLVGTPKADPSGRTSAGAVYLIYGELSAPTSQPSRQPTSQPSRQPTGQPTRQPSRQPISQPTRQPTSQPSVHPSRQPTGQPSRLPTSQPSRQPTSQPSTLPSRQPTSQPTSRPSRHPTGQPSGQPSTQPSAQPSCRPTSQPSSQPSQPSGQPSGKPSVQPSSQPSRLPSSQPSWQPSTQPSNRPTSRPSASPTCQPTRQPSSRPTTQPTAHPSSQPTNKPSTQSTAQPSAQPSHQPVATPTAQPSSQPSSLPSRQPVASPSAQPSLLPTTRPSSQPSARPTNQPSGCPTKRPSSQPTSVPSGHPTQQPQSAPTCQPTSQPSVKPTRQPAKYPSCAPSSQPSAQPSQLPSAVPSALPSQQPTGRPSCAPSSQPTSQPSRRLSGEPSSHPSASPSAPPTRLPTTRPASQPSCLPSAQPTSLPNAVPSRIPSVQPTTRPSGQPTAVPTCQLSSVPSAQPTSQPSAQPSQRPTVQPSPAPSRQPTVQPTRRPSQQPSPQPSSTPSRQPSRQPTTQPSGIPTKQPTCRPSAQPTSAPTRLVVTSATLGCEVKLVYVGRTFAGLQIALHGARDGYVEVFAVNKALSLSAVIASKQGSDNSYQITGGALTAVNMSSLLPSTDYDLYCAATSSQGITMPLSRISATKQSLRTACCKLITMTVQHPATVNVGQDLARAVTVVLEAPPSSSVVVTLQYAVRGQSSAGVQLLPSAWRYGNLSIVGSSTSIRLLALYSGNYSLQVSVTGPSAEEYTVVYADGRHLAVLPAGAAPAVPQLLQGTFSSDGSYVALSFDSATDRGSLYGAFPCRILLRFVSDSSSQCQWFSDSQLRVYPTVVGAGAVLGVGGNVTLLANTVRARCADPHRAASLCASYTLAAAAIMILAAPSTPTTPSVVVSAPSSIGGCNTLTVDLGGSAGAAGRPWDTVSFTVSTTPVSISAADRLLQFLSRNYTLSPPLSVPSAVLAKGYTYSIKVTLCNFLKACGSATKVVSVAESVAAVPMVNVAGQSARTVYRADPLSMVADAYIQSCSGSKSAAGLLYYWTIFELLAGASSFANSTLRSASQNPTVFKLPAYALSTGSVYLLSVKVLSLTSGLVSSASVTVTVQQSDLLAVLKGGSTRYAMVGEVVTLDASGSYDKDYPQQVLAAAAMTYSWQCLTVAPVLSAACAVTLLEANPGRSGVINVTSTYTALNTTTVVSVTVSDASRSSTAQARIIILRAPSPRLSISAVGPIDNVNTGKPLTLMGSLFLLATCTAAWSVDDPTIALATAARTPVQQLTLPTVGSTAVPFNLVIKSDALPQRATLQFTLSCGSTTVSTTVTTNGAPLPGSFTVKPAYGIELSTTFTFAAAQWVDPDLPLTYQFGFQSAVSLSNLVIVSRSELSYATSSLPAGDASRASAVDCSLRIYDNLGAFADRAAVVLVTSQDDADQASQLVLELLRSSSDSVQGMKTALAVGSSVVNAVNCTAAPSCGLLNRHLCRMTSGQCGTCLDGFAGDAGDRNTPCVALTAPPVQLATTKGCAYNCTGHGQCIFVSKVTGSPVAKCTLADTDCDATCACVDNYSGEFCEIDPVTLRRRREVRSNLILSLNNLTAQEDINTESVAAWSANLYALSIRPHEVSQSDAAVLADIANTTLHHAIALGVDSYADMLGILQATDAVASLLRYNYNPNDYRDADFNTSRSYVNNTAARFVPVVSTFGDMVSNLMVVGENETTLVYDNFRMTVAVAAGSRIQGSHSVLAGEQQSGAASTVALQTVNDPVVPAVAIKVMSTNPRSYAVDTAEYVSSPVRLQVQAQESQYTSAAEYLSSIEFTFQHNTLQYKFEHYEVRNLTSTCTARNASQVFTYRCPDSGQVIRHNCSQGAGVHVSYCPKPVPACAMLALETAAITTPDACTVLNSTATYTTCRCTVAAGSSGQRRLMSTAEQQILDETGATDMLATTVYIASDFADTFKAADSLNDATLSSVLVVVLLLGSVWMAGLSVLFVEWTLYKWNPAKEKIAKESEGVQSILTYVDSVIPKVFARGTSSVQRFVMEIAEHHVLFQLVTVNTPAERWFLMMQALTELTLLFFLTAAFFDISQPSDDGTCPNHSAQPGCLSRTSPFDYTQKYCKWIEVGADGGEGQCVYNVQSISTRALFYMTVLTTVISSIVSIPIDLQFATLKAPTATSLEGSKVSAMVDTVVSGARRVSNAGLAFFEPPRVAPTPSSKPGVSKSKSFMFLEGRDSVVANREIPASIVEVSMAARGSLHIIGRNASTLALGAEGASRALRSRSVRIVQRRMTSLVGAHLSKRSAELRLPELDALPAASGDAVLLLQDIVQQRLLMNTGAKDTGVFDAQWGVLSDGAGNYTICPEAADCIQSAVQGSSKEVSRLDSVLSNYSLQHAGLEMLHLFMLDLLGRNTIAAKVFREKFGEEFGHSRAVLGWHKYFAAAALLALNAFFMYFVMIKGVQKGRDWQLQYVACCLIQVGVDILLFETVECAWLNFLVPQYVHEEVASAAEKLRSLTQRIAGLHTDIEKAQPELEVTKFFLNAPAHLFVSTKLAKKKPQLLESMIVSSYRHHLPGEICKTWPHCSMTEEDKRPTQARTWLSLLRWVLRGLTLSLQLFVGVPFAFQKVALRFVQPVVFSGVALIFYTVFTSIVGPAVFGVLLLALVVSTLRRWCPTGAATATAVHPTVTDDVEVPTFIDDDSSSCDYSVVNSSEEGWLEIGGEYSPRTNEPAASKASTAKDLITAALDKPSPTVGDASSGYSVDLSSEDTESKESSSERIYVAVTHEREALSDSESSFVISSESSDEPVSGGVESDEGSSADGESEDTLSSRSDACED
jgi:hypothetical protein